MTTNVRIRQRPLADYWSVRPPLERLLVSTTHEYCGVITLGAVCFDVYDRDGQGAINLEQLKSVLSCVMQPRDTSGVDSDVDQEGTVFV